MGSPRVYLAGPDVFLPEARKKAESLRRVCERHGLEGCFPLDIELELERLAPRERGLAISEANEELIRSCDGVLANMTPFRGPSVDVGTAFEIGFAHALGKAIVGYTESDEEYRPRVRSLCGGERRRADGTPEDPQGMAIEDFGLVDNLMIDGAMIRSGGAVVRPSDVGEPGVGVFEWAVRVLASRLKELQHAGL